MPRKLPSKLQKGCFLNITALLRSRKHDGFGGGWKVDCSNPQVLGLVNDTSVALFLLFYEEGRLRAETVCDWSFKHGSRYIENKGQGFHFKPV